MTLKLDHVDAPGAMRGRTTLVCRHAGSNDHGNWTYEGDLHGTTKDQSRTLETVYGTGTRADALISARSMPQTGGSNAPATLRFVLEHEASAGIFWGTSCDGFHLCTPLDVLFGFPATAQWTHDNGVRG